MNKKTLSQAMGNISDKYILEAMAAESRARLAGNGKKAGGLRRTGRTLLIAAALILALAVSAAAVVYYQYGIRDAVMELPEGSAEQEENAGGDDTAGEGLFSSGTYGDGREQYYYSMGGYDKESPEYKAEQEWLYYLCKDNSTVYDEREKLSYSDPHQLYLADYQSMADRLDALAEKYGLSLAQAEYHVQGTYYEGDAGQTVESVCQTLGVEPFVLSELDTHTGVLYDEGSFEINGDLTYPGAAEPIFVNFYCAMDGTLPIFQIMGEDPNSLICESVTLDGVTADLALGEHNSMIFVTLENCHVLVQVQGGKDEPYNATQTIDMAALEAIAGCFDYGKVDQFDRAQRSEKIAGLFVEQMETFYKGLSDRAAKAQAVYDELGGYAITALPEDYSFHSLFTTSVEESIEISTPTAGCVMRVSIEYMQAGNEDEERTITLDYRRHWADWEQTELKNLLDITKPYTECTVNGCEARYKEVRAGTWPLVNELQWLDEDRDLMFKVSVPENYTMEQAIALAESVAPAE